MSKSKDKDKDIKKFLQNTTVGIEYLEENDGKIYSISPVMDYIMGGMKEGTTTIITGPPKHGKTATALSIAKAMQEHGFKIHYINGEHRAQARDFKSIEGFDTSKERFSLITSTPGNILTAEKAVDSARYILEHTQKSLVIIDSFSHLCPEQIFATNSENEGRDPTSKIFSNFCKRISPVLDINKNILIGITHEYANTSGKGYKAYSEASGSKLQYTCDFKLREGYTKAWENENEESIGLEISVKCITSAITPPLRDGTCFLRFGHGLDFETEAVDMILETQDPILKQSGSWFEIDGQKFQGRGKLIAKLKEEPELYKILYNRIWERLGNKTRLDGYNDAGD